MARRWRREVIHFLGHWYSSYGIVSFSTSYMSSINTGKSLPRAEEDQTSKSNEGGPSESIDVERVPCEAPTA